MKTLQLTLVKFQKNNSRDKHFNFIGYFSHHKLYWLQKQQSGLEICAHKNTYTLISESWTTINEGIRS